MKVNFTSGKNIYFVNPSLVTLWQERVLLIDWLVVWVEKQFYHTSLLQCHRCCRMVSLLVDMCYKSLIILFHSYTFFS